ncbi:hypothetical protein CL614_04250 [archaeon]|nr:hypothetical protein [archaeon]|tara:strand:- start:658 stop:1146 length:489 start_codon:yes stop_codon:yes gene_type:complete
MKFDFLFKKVLDDEQVKGLLDKNYFLASVFCMPKVSSKISIDKYSVHLYDSETNKVVSVEANDNLSISEPEDAVNRMTELSNQKYIDPEKIVSGFMKDIKETIGNIMITLHNKEIKGKVIPVWTFVFILNNLSVLTIDADAKTGKELSKERSSLVQRVSRAS